MTLNLIETKTTEGGTPLCVWRNEVGQTFTVQQYEIAVSDYEDFCYLYRHRPEFKNLSAVEFETFFATLESIEQSDPNNLRGYKR